MFFVPCGFAEARLHAHVEGGAEFPARARAPGAVRPPERYARVGRQQPAPDAEAVADLRVEPALRLELCARRERPRVRRRPEPLRPARGRARPDAPRNSGATRRRGRLRRVLFSRGFLLADCGLPRPVYHGRGATVQRFEFVIHDSVAFPCFDESPIRQRRVSPFRIDNSGQDYTILTVSIWCLFPLIQC